MTRIESDIEERPRHAPGCAYHLDQYESECDCRRVDFGSDIAKLTEERGSVYGPPKENFRRIAAIQAITGECPDPLIRVGLDMLAVKMARLCHSPRHRDSIRDIIGYGECLLMLLDDDAKCGEEVTR
jgi:hypothetical protein